MAPGVADVPDLHAWTITSGVNDVSAHVVLDEGAAAPAVLDHLCRCLAIERLSFGVVTPDVSLPVLAAWETLIGLGLLSGRFLRATLLLLALQMAGAATPLVLFPGEAFTQFPFAPTLEGQYIIKNVVLIGAAMVVGATVRGGRLVAEPQTSASSAG
jgi:uncharacterized membrane protein YphA (DoxX/SURF4 family)